MLSELNALFGQFSRNLVSNLAEAILNDIESFAAHWHPLGFVIAKVGSDAKYQYRLHLWPIGKRRPKWPNWPIHNHVFHLESLVLRGIVGSEEIYLVNSGDQSFKNEIYTVVYTANGSEIVSSGMYACIKKGPLIWTEAGDKYEIKKGTFHQSIVCEETFAASLVRTSAASKDASPLVVGRPGFSKRYSCPSLPVPNREFVNLLQQLGA